MTTQFHSDHEIARQLRWHLKCLQDWIKEAETSGLSVRVHPTAPQYRREYAGVIHLYHSYTFTNDGAYEADVIRRTTTKL